jgi:hypothetical protein
MPVYTTVFLKMNRQFETCKKLRESRKRPGVAQKVPGGLGSQIFMTFGA